jgi:pimeloyl-ACP methyl ester carboxylesterase
MNPRSYWIVCLLGILLAGCARPLPKPDLGGIYNRSAKYHGAGRNPVIVIPGILGSKLKVSTTGQTAWGAFSGQYVNPNTPEGARLAALPMSQGVPLRELTDEIVPDGALDRVKLSLLGVPVTVNAYAGVLSTLGAGGYRDAALSDIDYGGGHFTCFQFAYDWRRDNVENAQLLHRFIIEKRAYVQEEMKKLGQDAGNVKFDIVAHSMGGLIARYYLMYGDADLPADGSTPAATWEGAKYVERLIQVGTPNSGAVDAVIDAVEGSQIAPVVPKYQPAIIGTMPSVYQLMPRSRHAQVVDSADSPLDIYDVKVWDELNWGLLSPKQMKYLRLLLPDAPDDAARRRIAMDHLTKCLDRARQFHAALDVPAQPPAGAAIALMAGDAAKTHSRLSVDRSTGRIRVVETAPGDGTVLRSSALMDERLGGEWSPNLVSPIRFSQVSFFFTNHLGLTTDPGFTDNVLFLLLERPRDAAAIQETHSSAGDILPHPRQFP